MGLDDAASSGLSGRRSMSVTDGAWDPPVVNAIPPKPSLRRWSSLPDDRDLFVIHAALLHTGKVLWFSGHAEAMHYATVSFVWTPIPAPSRACRSRPAWTCSAATSCSSRTAGC